jgi:phage terminase Nu1 subunit (DNA packaging protein)
MASRAKKPKLKEPPKQLLGRTQLALAFGVTPLRITKWAADGMPVVDRGGRGRQSRYDLAAVVDWRVRTQVQAITGGAGADGEPLNLGQERAALAQVQRQRIAMDIKAKEGDLLPADEVRRVVGGAFHAVRARLLALGQSVAERCAVASQTGTAAVQAVIDDAVHEALAELAEARDMDETADRHAA